MLGERELHLATAARTPLTLPPSPALKPVRPELADEELVRQLFEVFGVMPLKGGGKNGGKVDAGNPLPRKKDAQERCVNYVRRGILYKDPADCVDC